MDAYVDLMLQKKMVRLNCFFCTHENSLNSLYFIYKFWWIQENHLDALLADIVSLARDKFLSEEEQASLQSIIFKLLSHFENLQEVLSLVILSSPFSVSTFKLQETIRSIQKELLSIPWMRSLSSFVKQIIWLPSRITSSRFWILCLGLQRAV